MELTTNIWRIYPDDAPTSAVGRDVPGGSRIFAHRIRWQPDGSSDPGDAVHVKDAKGRTVFFHEAVAGESFFEQEFAAPLAGPLEVPALASGVLEIIIE